MASRNSATTDVLVVVRADAPRLVSICSMRRASSGSPEIVAVITWEKRAMRADSGSSGSHARA